MSDSNCPNAPANSSAHYQNAGDIAVKHFELKLWLPLLIDANWPNSNNPEQPPDPLWRRSKLPEPDSHDEVYGAYLYFHPGVRRFLWGGKLDVDGTQTQSPLLQVWELVEPWTYWDMVLPQGQGDNFACFQVRFQLQSVRFFTFNALPHSGERHQVGILEIHASLLQPAAAATAADSAAASDSADSAAPPITLADIQDLLDFARRSHPSYFPGEHKNATLKLSGGRIPWAHRLRRAHEPDSEWPAAQGNLEVALQAALSQQKQVCFESVRNRTTPLLPHWQQILGPRLSEGTHQLEDERMAQMALVLVDDPLQISPGDWRRLCFSDYRGNSHSRPYSAYFLDNFEERHCYDRFYDPASSWMRTRFLNAGYAMTIVGEGTSNFNRNVLSEQFNHHYGLMGLLLQYNKAALLHLSDELAQASTDRVQRAHRHGFDQTYHTRMLQLQEAMVHFSHQHWFDGFTNQIQGQEIGDWWSRLLRLPELYQAVKQEADSAYQLVLNQAQQRQTAVIETMTKWTVGLALSALAVSLMGAGFPFDKPLALWLSESTPWAGKLDLTRLMCLIILALLVAVVFRKIYQYWFLKSLDPEEADPHKPSR